MKTNQIPPGSFGIFILGETLSFVFHRDFGKMEMKIVASYLLGNYHWEILPNQSLEPVQLPTNHSKDGLRVRFHPR